MNDIILMQIVYGMQGLGKILKGFSLSKQPFGVLVIKKIAVFCIFHDHIDVIPID